MLKTGLNNFPCQTLGDLCGLSDAAAFRDKSWHVRAGRKVPAFTQGFDVETDGDFVNFNDLSLASRGRIAFAFHAEVRS